MSYDGFGLAGRFKTKVRLDFDMTRAARIYSDLDMATATTDELVAWIAGKIDCRGAMGAVWRGRILLTSA
jgi:hypothetical protein